MCLNSTSLFFIIHTPETVMTVKTPILVAIFEGIIEEIESGHLDEVKVENALRAILSGEFLGRELLLVPRLKVCGNREHRQIKERLSELKATLGDRLIESNLLCGELPEQDAGFAENTLKLLNGNSNKNASISEASASIVEAGASICTVEEAVQYILGAGIAIGEWSYIPIKGIQEKAMLCVTRKNKGHLYIDLIVEEEGKVYDPTCIFVYKVSPA